MGVGTAAGSAGAAGEAAACVAWACSPRFGEEAGLEPRRGEEVAGVGVGCFYARSQSFQTGSYPAARRAAATSAGERVSETSNWGSAPLEVA